MNRAASHSNAAERIEEKEVVRRVVTRNGPGALAGSSLSTRSHLLTVVATMGFLRRDADMGEASRSVGRERMNGGHGGGWVPSRFPA